MEPNSKSHASGASECFGRRGPKQKWRMITCACVLLLCLGETTCEAEAVVPKDVSDLTSALSVSTAVINYTYTDPDTHTLHSEGGEIGRFGRVSPLHVETGLVVHVVTDDGGNHGCTALVNEPPAGPWIALIQRGHCKFQQKVINALLHNASAVVIYNNKDEDGLVTMEHFVHTMPSVFIHKADGDKLAGLVDRGLDVHMNVSLGQVTIYHLSSESPAEGEVPARPQPLLIISVTLITFLISGLTGLLVYGIRHSKYQRQKKRRRMIFTLQENGLLHQSLLVADLHDHPSGPHAENNNNINNNDTPIYNPRH